MAKYKQHVLDMFSVHKEMFDSFEEIHAKYAKDPIKWQSAFNEKGMEVMQVIRRWENSLCSKSESGKYGKFSSSLAEKFHEEIKKHFPLIDKVGMLV